MNRDDRIVSEMIARSVASGVVERLGRALASAANDSRVLTLWHDAAARALHLDLVTRFRCAGIVAATAALTHLALIRLTSERLAPVGGQPIVAVIAAAGAVVAWLAPPMAIAWRDRGRA